jgi:hypothetical protein
LLLAPGLLYLAFFFVVPLGFLAYQSLESGSFDVGYSFTWAWGNYWDAIHNYRGHFIRSLEYAGIATVLALVFAYPLAYWIAFRGGRWKNLLLLFIVAPFFVTYLIRTLAWETILADHGPVVSVLRHIGILGSDGRLLATSTAVVAGITYNFFPFMALPLYVSLERRAADRGRAGPLREQVESVPPRDVAALPPRRRRRHPADVHSCGGRLHQRAAARLAEEPHDRERHPVEVPRADGLSGCGLDVLRPDGGDPAHGRAVRARGRHGEADRMSVARLRLAPVRETMFPSRAPFFMGRLSSRAAEIAACAEERVGGNLTVSPSALSLAHRPEIGR